MAPWIGLVFYLAIGRPYHPQWRRLRVAQLWPIMHRSVSSIARVARPAALAQDVASTASLVSSIGQMPPLHGNAVEFLTDYDETIDRLVDDIARAERHVHLLFYIFAVELH